MLCNIKKIKLNIKLKLQGSQHKILCGKKHIRLYKTSSSCAGYAFSRYFLYLLGNGKLSLSVVNTHDFYTDRQVSRIPKVYIYCIKEGDHVYAFDVRSLNGYYREISTHRLNPYTMNPLNCEHIASLEKKNKWLHKLGFHQLHLIPPRILPLNILTERYAVGSVV